MRHRQAALGHHLHQISQAQLESKVPAHAQDDDFAVEVATLEQLLQALQLSHCRPSASSAASIADRIAPFAPEPHFVPDDVVPGDVGPVLLDTCVYLDGGKGKLP